MKKHAGSETITEGQTITGLKPSEFEAMIEKMVWGRIRNEFKWFEKEAGICRTAVLDACVNILRQKRGAKWFMQGDAFDSLVKLLQNDLFISASEIDDDCSEWVE